MATAAQLIARVKVEGISQYKSDLRQAGIAIDSVADRASRAGRAISTFLIGSGVGISAGIVALGIDAVKAASQFEQFRVTLELLSGSAERAKAKLNFIKQLAIPSTFTFQQLAAAGTQLEAFRVPLEKALPLIAKLGAAFPNKQIEDFINLFGRLGSGDFPDLEALSGAGLSKLDFMKKGIKFDSQGSLLSSSRETMNALERIINDRYGDILEKVSTTTASKLATVRDKWEENLRKIGDALIKYVNPALDKISSFLDRLSKDHSFDQFLKNIGATMTKFVGIMFGTLGILMAVVAAVKFAFKDFIGGTIALIGSVAAFVGGAYATTKLGQFFKGLQTNGGHWEDSSRFPGAAVPGVPPGIEYPDNPALKSINDTAENTRRTAVATEKMSDITRHALGGGNLGAIGVTPVEFGRHRARNVNVKADAGVWSAVVADIARQVAHQLQLDNARAGGR